MALPNTMNLFSVCFVDLILLNVTAAQQALRRVQGYLNKIYVLWVNMFAVPHICTFVKLLNYHERGIASGLEFRCMMFLHHVHWVLGNTLPRLILYSNLTDHMIHSLTTWSGCTTFTQIHNAKQTLQPNSLVYMPFQLHVFYYSIIIMHAVCMTSHSLNT